MKVDSLEGAHLHGRRLQDGHILRRLYGERRSLAWRLYARSRDPPPVNCEGTAMADFIYLALGLAGFGLFAAAVPLIERM